jgi:hypothetical protein
MSRGLFGRQYFVDEQPSVVSHNPAADGAIVVLMLHAVASTRVQGFLGDEALVVMVLEVLAIDALPAGRLLRFEAAVRVHVATP